jgi:hypothetical protein
MRRYGCYFHNEYIGSLRIDSNGAVDPRFPLILCMDEDDLTLLPTTIELQVQRRSAALNMLEKSEMDAHQFMTFVNHHKIQDIATIENDILSATIFYRWEAIRIDNIMVYERLFDHDRFEPEGICDLLDPKKADVDLLGRDRPARKAPKSTFTTSTPSTIDGAFIENVFYDALSGRLWDHHKRTKSDFAGVWDARHWDKT